MIEGGLQRAEGGRRHDPADEACEHLLLRDLVAYVGFERSRGQVILDEEPVVSRLVELAGQRIEQGRRLAQFGGDQGVDGADAFPRDQRRERLLIGDLLEGAPIQALLDRVLHGDRGRRRRSRRLLLLLLSQLGAIALE